MHNVQIFIAFSLIGPLIKNVAATDYCIFGKDHTMCKFQNEEPGPNCSPGTKVERVTARHKKEFLLEHNKLRMILANGANTEDHCSSAADMIKLEWDWELETIALRHTLQCTFEHDKNRNVERFKVGQNVFKTTNLDTSNFAKLAITSWFEEIKNVPPSFINNTIFNEDLFPVAHFTQIIWSTTLYIGCSMTNAGSMLLIACNYGPTGNYVGRHVYEVGAPATNCPEYFESENGLCVNPIGNLYISSKSKAHNLVISFTILFLTCTVLYCFQ